MINYLMTHSSHFLLTVISVLELYLWGKSPSGSLMGLFRTDISTITEGIDYWLETSQMSTVFMWIIYCFTAGFKIERNSVVQHLLMVQWFV